VTAALPVIAAVVSESMTVTASVMPAVSATSPSAGFTTGQVLGVDGGSLLAL
jgi:hypothetical protein